jgi:hypothetical protein
MKNLKFYFMPVLALVGGMLSVSCSDDNLVEEIAQPTENVVTLKASLNLGDITSRSLTKDGKKTFTEGEQIAVVYSNTSHKRRRAMSGLLSAKDIKDNGKDAEFTVELKNPSTEGDFMIIYPSKIVKRADYINNGEYPISYSRLIAQDGTLETIGKELDYSMYVGKYSEPTKKSVPFTLKNQLAILKLTIRDTDKKDITSSICRLTIQNDDNRYVVNKASENVIYVAMRPVSSDQTIIFHATDGKKLYAKEVSGKTLQAGKIYPINLIAKEAEPEVQAVDLGLSVKWANMNLGAKSETDKGLMFAWGETVGYSFSNSDYNGHKFDWNNYKFGEEQNLNKYVNKHYYNSVVDSKTILEAEDDAVTKEYANSWRMPTKEEFEELCTSNKIKSREYVENYKDSGVDGWLITANNGNSIFMPFAGNYKYTLKGNVEEDGGFYWTSTLSSDTPSKAYYANLIRSNWAAYLVHDGLMRYYGMSIRGVKP